MSFQNTAAVLILAGVAYLAWGNKQPDTPERRAEREAAAEFQRSHYIDVAAKISALPGFNVPSGQAEGVMRIVTTQRFSEYEARKFCMGVQARLGFKCMVRLVDDTGEILATRF